MGMRWGSKAVAGLVVVSLMGACSGDDSRQGRETSTSTTTVGEGITTAPSGAAEDADDAGDVGTTSTVASGLSITVVDQRRRPLAGAPVTITGPTAGRIDTDASGVARWAATAGSYGVSVAPGCFADVQAPKGANGTVELVKGGAAEVNLQVIVRRRHLPSGPTSYRWLTPRPPDQDEHVWVPGQPYELSFTLTDQCTKQPAPSGSTARLALKATNGLEVIGPLPGRADASGKVAVRVRCAAGTDTWSLEVTDPEEPGLRVDVLNDTVHPQPDPSCQ